MSSHEVRIGADPATVHLPPGRTALPVALLLQGGNVPRESYGRFARTVAASASPSWCPIIGGPWGR
ncbi:hypothetical protein ACFQ0B_50400 [Nonomuraea thailandensis]